MINIGLRGRVKGMLRVRLRRADGSVRLDTGWFSNLITNAGLDMLGGIFPANSEGNNGVAPYRCSVGTSNTAPAFTDTTLGNSIGYSPGLNAPIGSSPKYNAGYAAGSPGYLHAVGTFVFGLGAIVGNIAEIGTGIIPTSTPSQLYLFSHALIMSGGTPTTISVTSADQLEVTYDLRLYVDTTDTAWSLTISGTSYSGVIRRANLGTANEQIVTSISGGVISVYNGSIGTVTAGPSGTSDSVNISLGGYTSGSYSINLTGSFSTSQGNLSGGITALLVNTSTFGDWQLSVTPAIAKDSTKTLSLTFSVSWARYP